ncbi:hypothetical protein DKX38_023483 [Salix brachista]|uniref:Uncharacterized protein n=1 Tax=Salix brachista TaxID=2182728 RepID=A0A5N5JMQ9_9ROSI|nr:hypothetical protein DKX38_023483 [Salix brachista]
MGSKPEADHSMPHIVLIPCPLQSHIKTMLKFINEMLIFRGICDVRHQWNPTQVITFKKKKKKKKNINQNFIMLDL